MHPLQSVRRILIAIAEDVDVLPAIGGAAEDLDLPDVEEREDKALSGDERVFEAIFERGATASASSLYRPAPPAGRSERHLLRYFLDGSFRSFFIGTMLENERESPLHFAQIGACALRREDDGTMRREMMQIDNLLMAGKHRLSETAWTKLNEFASAASIRLIDLTESDIVSGVFADFDLRNKAAGKVRYAMHHLESAVISAIAPKLSPECWLVADGSLLFNPTLAQLCNDDQIKPVIGVAKNFRKDPLFVIGRGPRAERRSIFQMLAGLQVAHRTVAFRARGGKVVFWYVRLRDSTRLDYPLMGVIKVELANPSQEMPPSELIDALSRALVAERSVTPHGQDPRWHAHLYPVFLAERTVKENLLAREVVQQFLKWR